MENLEWTPVTEKFPDVEGKYLVTYKGRYSICNLVAETSYYEGVFKIPNVIAWMDLPLAYQPFLN